MMNVRTLLLVWSVSLPLLAQASPPAEPAGKEVAKPKPAESPKGTDRGTDKGAVKSPVKPAAANELEAIRQSSHAFVEAFNSRNARAVAALWTADGDYIDETGRVFTGREEIEQEYARFFKEHTNLRLKVVIDSLRLLSDDAAIEDGRVLLDPPAAGAPAISKYTAVHVKVDGKWLMSTVRDVRTETPSGYRHVADLEFLIGVWTAEEHGSQLRSEFRWVANKSYILRDYTVTHPDHSVSSGVQIIGYNPQASAIQSWNFTSDGGHAVGTWTPHDGGWTAEVHGITPDGVATTAVNRLTSIDDNAYVWQSVRRTAGGNPLADTNEVVLKRQAAK